MSSKTLDSTMYVRMQPRVLNKFRSICRSRYGRSCSEVIREMVTAANEGRLTITPTEKQKAQLGELYNVDGK